jgi:restriction system-associated AAA family ATPase
MKLLRVNLLSEFRGLPKNFELKFNNEHVDLRQLDPICLIGLNGSGKSNLLEVLSEIFYFLEDFSKAKLSDLKKFEKEFGFEIEYLLSKNVFNTNKSNDQEEAKSEQIKILIKKEVKKSPIAYVWDDEDEYTSASPETFKTYLPNQIIAYSSGMNELISNPYIKMDFQYLDEFTKLAKDKANLDYEIENKMFFMDYDINKLITISNFLFDKPMENDYGVINLKRVKDEIKIKELHSFSISIRLRNNEKKSIVLPSFLNIEIEKLKKCATIYDEKPFENKQGKYFEYEFYFYINDATRALVKRYFKTAHEFYKTLYFFRLLNNHLISATTQKEIKEANDKVNISALIPKFEEKEKVFNISDIAFRKLHSKEPVYYKQLSDGEHQFLHVFGILLLMNQNGTLFLFDEPETHFNPNWRSKFVSIINESIKDEMILREQELLLTTHSPFIVSDCKKENVFKFQRDEKTNKILTPKNPDNETYGTSVDMIYWNIFKKHQSISDVAFNELESIRKKVNNDELTKEEAVKELSRFGDSFEKMNIIGILKKKYSS